MKQVFRPDRILRLLFWETTIKCNLSCAHCRRLESDEAVCKDLSTEQGKDLIKQLSALGEKQSCKPVLVFSGGEPLCRDDLFELINFAGSLDIVPALATNATLIDAQVAEQISNAGIIRVAVSLDGATAEVHNSLRQLTGSFERALKGISHLREKKMPFQVNITLTKRNAHQLQDVYKLACTLGAVAVHVFMLVPVGCGRVLADTDMLSSEQIEQKMFEICRLENQGQLQLKVTCGPHYQRVIRQKGLYQSHIKEGTADNSVPGRQSHKGVLRGCLAGLGVLFVSHQGDVFPCGYLPVKCGSVLREKIEEIWYKNKDLAKMRDSESLEGKCGVCGYRQVCGGCRGRAYAATGNYMAQEPFCAHIPPMAASWI